MGITGLNSPVMWGSLITTFVFFIGVSHSGTLVSAILFFTRSPLRAAVGRSAEGMTVIAILTAGLYPVIHIGRSWLFFFVLPYPNQRGIWPNFRSPLTWDVFAICSYVTVSALFVYMGMLPDLALLARRVGGWRRPLYRALSLGFSGTDGEWCLFERAYPIFAGIVIPLAISVHSVVSWDFAMTLMPGWHSAIFAPYFVAGAIFSGIAMAILLLERAPPRLPPRPLYQGGALRSAVEAHARHVAGDDVRLRHRVLHGLLPGRQRRGGAVPLARQRSLRADLLAGGGVQQRGAAGLLLEAGAPQPACADRGLDDA